MALKIASLFQVNNALALSAYDSGRLLTENQFSIIVNWTPEPPARPHITSLGDRDVRFVEPETYVSNHGHSHTEAPQLLMCGQCQRPALRHDIRSEFFWTCDRGVDGPFEIRYGFDYFQHSTFGIVPVEDLSLDYEADEERRAEWLASEDFVPSLEFLDEQDSSSELMWNTKQSVPPTSYVHFGDSTLDSAIWRWHDKDPLVTTHALDEWLWSPLRHGEISHYRVYADLGIDSFGDTVPAEPKKRNAFVEGEGGYYSLQVFDIEKTERYSLQYLNYFIDKQGRDAVGGVRFKKWAGTATTPGRIEAYCVQDTCTSQSFDLPVTATRAAMEDFVITIIRHGNNHAARWFRQKVRGGHSTYYKVHAANCLDVFKCNEHYAHLHYCPVKDDSIPTNGFVSVTEDDPVDTQLGFLLEHKAVCTSADCTHDELIWEFQSKSLAPSLTDAA